MPAHPRHSIASSGACQLRGLWTFDIPAHNIGRTRAPGPHLFHYIVSGSYRLGLAGTVHHISQGDAIWYIDSEAVTWTGGTTPVRFWSCQFTADGLEPPPAGARVWPGDALFRASFRDLIDDDADDAAAPWRRQSALARLIAAAVATHPAPPAHPWAAIEAWAIRNDGLAMSADTLAEAHGLSRATLDRRCRELHGVGPARRLRALRLERALDMLTQTSLPVSEVADRFGYRDGAELARACRREYGLCPTQLRTQANIDRST